MFGAEVTPSLLLTTLLELVTWPHPTSRAQEVKSNYVLCSEKNLKVIVVQGTVTIHHIYQVMPPPPKKYF